jgi:hypothetical protein
MTEEKEQLEAVKYNSDKYDKREATPSPVCSSFQYILYP